MADELAVYGIRLAGLPVPGGQEPPADWPRWTIARGQAAPGDDAPGLDVWESRARIGMPGIGQIRLDRDARTIAFETFDPWPPAGVLHPGLAPAGTVIAHWMGRTSIHGAAVTVNGRAWGLIGEQGAGKSTLAATTGRPVLTDDLLVVDDACAYAGPATIDLRDGRTGGVALGRLGARERWRLSVPGAGSVLPLAGFVALAWTDADPHIDAVDSPAERLAILDAHLSLPATAERLLTLAAFPLLRFGRTPAPERAVDDAAALVSVLEAHA